MRFSNFFHQLLDNGNYQEVNSLIQSYAGENEIGDALVYGRYLVDTGDFDTARQILTRVLFASDNISDQVAVFLLYIKSLARLDFINLSYKYLIQLHSWDIEDKQLQFDLELMTLFVLILLGDFDNARKVEKQVKYLTEELDTPGNYAKYYMQKARIYDYQGSLLPAIDYYQKSMEYAKQENFILDYLDALHNISNIYQYQGRYRLAVEGYEKELEHFKRMGFEFYTAITKGDLAWSYFLQGRDNKAIELLLGTYSFLEDFETSDNQFYQAEVITRIIIVAAYSNNELDIDPYLEKLKQIQKETPSIRVSRFLEICNATLLMISNTFTNIAKAISIFEDIIQTDQIIDIEFRLYAYMSIINILFQNYEYSGKTILLDQINEKAEKLFEFAEQQESQSMRLQAEWVRARVLLAQGEREIALKQFTAVLNQSNQLGFDHIANQMSKEINHIDDDLQRTIDQTDFAYFRHDLTRQMLFSGQIQGREEPQLFFIMGDAGMTLYTRYFESDIELNVNLISSFVNAIETFGSEAMQHAETLNQIQYQENKILIEAKKYISLVFVIKGQTYPAKKKLLEFSKILDLPAYRELFHSEMIRFDDATVDLLDHVFDSIFAY